MTTLITSLMGSGGRTMKGELTWDAEKHEQHHLALAAMQDKIDRIWQYAYANAKQLKAHAPRKFATRSTHSQLVSQVAAWRSHLYGMHGVKQIGPFVSLAELQAQHEAIHSREGWTP